MSKLSIKKEKKKNDWLVVSMVEPTPLKNMMELKSMGRMTSHDYPII
jgi:hypothetical protein